jgi:hypothetical protein
MLFIIKKTPGGKGTPKKKGKSKQQGKKKPGVKSKAEIAQWKVGLAKEGIKGKLAETVIEDALWAEKKEPGSGATAIVQRAALEKMLVHKKPKAQIAGVITLCRLAIEGDLPVDSVLKRISQLYILNDEIRPGIVESLFLTIKDARKAKNREFTKKALELLENLTDR